MVKYLSCIVCCMFFNDGIFKNVMEVKIWGDKIWIKGFFGLFDILGNLFLFFIKECFNKFKMEKKILMFVLNILKCFI